MIGKHLGIPVKHVRTTENPLRLTKNDSVPCHRLHLQGGISAACYFLLNRYWGRYTAALTEQINTLKLIETVADSSSDAIFAKDLDGRYLVFNQAASNFVGKPAKAVIGRDDSAFFP